MGQRPATAPAKARASSPGGQVARQGSPSPSAAAAQTTSSASLATAATSMLSVPSVAMTKFARAAQAKHHSVNVETSSKIAARTAFHLLVLRKRLTGLDPQQDFDGGDAVAPKSPPKRQQSFKLQDHPPAKIEL